MLYEELLSKDVVVTLPWLGGQLLHDQHRSWKLRGPQPEEMGWHRFSVSGSRHASWLGPGEADADFSEGRDGFTGYLVDDRLIPDGVAVKKEAHEVFARGLQVFLSEPGLGRFVRAFVVRNRDGKLIFARQEFPLGPEEEVLEAFQDQREDLDHIRGVTPALHLAFLWHSWRRKLTEAERQRLERLAQLEAEAREAEAQRLRYREALEQVQTRKAARSFDEIARDALAISGAVLLDHRRGQHKDEEIVQFRFQQRRFECVIKRDSLRIVDSGICLQDHATGVRGDQRFTLESLPVVIDEAIRTHRLVVFRHVNG